MSDSDWGPDLDSIPDPDAVGLNPIFAMALKGNHQAPMATVADQIRALNEQLALKPGDLAIPGMSEANINNDPTLARILDASEYAELFPDWEERMLKSWRLTSWISHDDHHDGEQLGWFELARLFPIDQDMHDRLLEVFKETDKTANVEFPEDIQRHYSQYVDRLSDSDPKILPKRVTCPGCSSRDVELHGTSTVKMKVVAGQKEVDGKLVYTGLSETMTNRKITYHLHCTDCGARRALKDDEVSL